jgi:hypothetical protein
MTISITNVTPKSVELYGQTLTRQYAELIMLPLLVSQAGKDRVKVTKVAKAFEDAGLSLSAVPDASRFLFEQRQEQAEAERQRQVLAQDAVNRVQPLTQREIAEKRQERERKAAQIRAHGEAVRSGTSNGVGW